MKSIAMGMAAAVAYMSFSPVVSGGFKLPVGRSASTQQCEVQTVGVDSSSGDFALPVWNGRVWGQVFLAPDTLIRSITVWRRAEQSINLDPMHLYITEVDSAGRPDVGKVLLDGPSVVIPQAGDGVTPDRVTYAFDPPFRLPRTGYFWFGIKEDWCDFIFWLLADSLDSYPDGQAWILEPTGSLCVGLGCCPKNFGENFDLIFEVEFCIPPTTDVPFPRGDSWGRIKAHYR
jgi:hypothetical protein